MPASKATMQALEQELHKRGRAGASSSDVARALGMELRMASRALSDARAAGLIVNLPEHGHDGRNAKRWYALAFKPPGACVVTAEDASARRAAKLQDLARRWPKTLLAAAEAKGWQKGAVKVQFGPSCLDMRYTVRELPENYESVLDAAESRPWVSAMLGRPQGAA